jgi:hypothetical protein
MGVDNYVGQDGWRGHGDVGNEPDPPPTFAEVQDIIVDTIECVADDYQAYDWGPVQAALKQLSIRFEQGKAAERAARDELWEGVRG